MIIKKIINIIEEDFYKNNKISYVSIINKKSKSIFNIKPNKYKIKNESIYINQIYNRVYKDTGNNNESQNIGINGKNNYQNSSGNASNKCCISKIKKWDGNDNNSDSDSENDKCWLCLNSNYDEDNPLICLLP